MSMIHDHGDVADDLVEEQVVRDPLDFARILTLMLGIASVIVGAVGLARTGTENITGEATTVGWISMTALLAIAHIILGAVLIAGTTSASSAAAALGAAGTILLTAGIIALIEPVEALGWDTATGVTYVLAGTLALLATWASRTDAFVRHRVSTRSTRLHA